MPLKRIVLVAGIAIGASAIFRAAVQEPDRERAPVSIRPEPETEPVLARPDLARTTAPVEARSEPKPAAPETRLPDAARVEFTHDKMVFLLARELTLDAAQHRAVEEILKRRQARIEEYLAEVCRSGVFRVEEHHRRIEEFQSLSYAEMDKVLSSGQHRRFLELLVEGRLGDAVAFTPPPGITILE